MGRINVGFWKGIITGSKVDVVPNPGTADYILIRFKLSVARPDRDAGDGELTKERLTGILRQETLLVMVHRNDNPSLFDRILEENWRPGDGIFIKGKLTAKTFTKKNTGCPRGHVNRERSPITYVTPVFAERVASFGSDADSETHSRKLRFLSENREVSNNIISSGFLASDPRKIKTKDGLVGISFPYALDRKYFQASDPETRSDVLFVKVYGEQALEDRKRLKHRSEIGIEGFVQMRPVRRKAVCREKLLDENGDYILDELGQPVICGEHYTWEDRIWEIVPYVSGIDYHRDCRTDEEIAMLEAQEAEKRPTVLLTGTGVNPDEMSPQEFDAHLDEFYKGTVSEF